MIRTSGSCFFASLFTLLLTSACESDESNPPTPAVSVHPKERTVSAQEHAASSLRVTGTCETKSVATCGTPSPDASTCGFAREWKIGWFTPKPVTGLHQPWIPAGNSNTVKIVEVGANCYCVEFPQSPKAGVEKAIQVAGGELAGNRYALAGYINASTYKIAMHVLLERDACETSGSIFFKPDASGDSGATWGGGK